MTHSLNGNGIYKDLKVVQIYTGNGKWCTNEELLKISTLNLGPDISAIFKSNINIHDNKMLAKIRNKFGSYLSSDKDFH